MRLFFCLTLFLIELLMDWGKWRKAIATRSWVRQNPL